MLNEPTKLSTTFSMLEEDDGDKTLLLVDDDMASRTRLARALERKGFEVIDTGSLHDAMDAVRRVHPRFAVIELRLGDGHGLELVTELLRRRPDARITVLTAYASIATAVAAIKIGAIDYLSKPADPEAIERSLKTDGEQPLPTAPEDPMSADRVRWEHIQRVYHQYGCNVSETARRLHMHRRTLQRILSKHAPRDMRNTPVDEMAGSYGTAA